MSRIDKKYKQALLEDDLEKHGLTLNDKHTLFLRTAVKLFSNEEFLTKIRKGIEDFGGVFNNFKHEESRWITDGIHPRSFCYEIEYFGNFIIREKHYSDFFCHFEDLEVIYGKDLKVKPLFKKKG